MSEPRPRALWITAPGKAELRPVSVRAEHAPGNVYVRTCYSAVSRGTEALVFQGRVPRSEYQRMRAPFQEGDFPAPVKYGYVAVGVVEAGPENWRGRTVFCLYPHQTHFTVPIAAVVAVPEAVPPARAVLAANLETAINGLWDAPACIGDRVAVVGAGTVGCLIAWLVAQIPGTVVELIDINPRRQSVAAALGVAFRMPGAASLEADRVYHCSGNPSGLVTALSLAAFEATVVDMSWYGDAVVPLPLGEAFHAQRLTLKSSQVGQLAPERRNGWTHRQRLELALGLLTESTLDCLISGEDGFEDLPAVLARLAVSPGNTLCHRIRYP